MTRHRLIMLFLVFLVFVCGAGAVALTEEDGSDIEIKWRVYVKTSDNNAYAHLKITDLYENKIVWDQTQYRGEYNYSVPGSYNQIITLNKYRSYKFEMWGREFSLSSCYWGDERVAENHDYLSEPPYYWAITVNSPLDVPYGTPSEVEFMTNQVFREESDSEPPLSISVWTDKSEYEIGDIITIYYQTNKECTAKLTITKPDGGEVAYGPNEIPVCTRSKLGTAGYPTGTRTVTFEAWIGDEYKKATCYFDVVEEAKEVKFRGKILTDSLIISFYSFDVKIDEVLDDPTGNLQEGETVNVYGHRSGPAQVDDVTVGDEVEVFGEYRGYVGAYEQILLTDSDHYVKKIFPFDLEVTDISLSENLPAETKSLTITATVRNNRDYGVSNVYVTFLNGLEVIDLGFINYIPAYSSASVSITWDAPVKSFEPAPPNYYTNNIGAMVGDSSCFTNVIIGDTHGTGYTITHIAPSNLLMDVSNPQFGQLIIFDSKYRYLGTRELKPLSQLLTAVDDLLTASSACACAIGIQLAAVTEGASLSLCSGSVLVAGTTTIAANLLNDIAENWPEQLDFSSKDIESSSDGKIHILCVVSLDTVNENGEMTSNKYNLDYYYKDEMGHWIDYYHTKEYITDQSSNQISATTKCPVNLHAYDSEGRHVGLNSFGKIDLEISGSYYTGPDSEPESIVMLNQSEDVTFKVEALDAGKFNFTLMQSTDAKTTTVTYLDVPITETTVSTVDVNDENPTYTMEIDKYGDGTEIETKEPDSIESGNESGSESTLIGSATTPPNLIVTIPVSVVNVENVSGISFNLLYDPSIVTVSSVSASQNFTGSSVTSNIDNVNGITSIVLTNLNLISASAETPVIDIAFDITGGSGSSTYLDLQNVEFSDSEFNSYTPEVVVDGQITVGIKGDFNGNDRVDIGDVAKVAFMVAGKVQEDLNADFNNNGRVDIGDAAKIAFYLAGKVSEL